MGKAFTVTIFATSVMVWLSVQACKLIVVNMTRRKGGL